MRAPMIKGRAFLEALTEAGIITAEDRVRRVVIDAPIDGPLVVHVERYGDKRLLTVVGSLVGVDVLALEPREDGEHVVSAP